MSKQFLMYFFLISISMKCSDKVLNSGCQNCSDSKCVSQLADEIARKKHGIQVKDFDTKIEEEPDCYIITYTSIKYLNDPLKKGGNGLILKISKNNCKVIEYKKLK